MIEFVAPKSSFRDVKSNGDVLAYVGYGPWKPEFYNYINVNVRDEVHQYLVVSVLEEVYFKGEKIALKPVPPYVDIKDMSSLVGPGTYALHRKTMRR